MLQYTGSQAFIWISRWSKSPLWITSFCLLQNEAEPISKLLALYLSFFWTGERGPDRKRGLACLEVALCLVNNPPPPTVKGHESMALFLGRGDYSQTIPAVGRSMRQKQSLVIELLRKISLIENPLVALALATSILRCLQPKLFFQTLKFLIIYTLCYKILLTVFF